MLYVCPEKSFRVSVLQFHAKEIEGQPTAFRPEGWTLPALRFGLVGFGSVLYSSAQVA